MLLCFTLIDLKNQARYYSWWFNDLETTFDALNYLIAEGNQLIKAELVDKESCISLPPEAFDGNPSSASLQELEREWQRLLNKAG